jgi:hypothetical protein
MAAERWNGNRMDGRRQDAGVAYLVIAAAGQGERRREENDG